MRIRLIALSVVWIFVTSMAIADVIPGRWEKVDALEAGSPLILELVAGDRIDGEFVASTPEDLTIRRQEGNPQTLPKSAIAQISLVRRAKHRAAIGAAIGAGAGVATGLAISSGFDETFFARGDLMALTCGGIGALTGALIGNAVGRPEQQEVVFRSR